MTRERLILACKKLCARCAMGHTPDNSDGHWSHGVDQLVGEGMTFLPPDHCQAWAVWEVIAEMDAEADQDDADGSVCPKCKTDDTEWEQCWMCHGEGQFDAHDEDAVNYAPGEEFEECTECNGRGGYLACRNCQAIAEAKAKEKNGSVT